MARGQGGIGDEILGYWLFFVLPGAVVFAVTTALAYRRFAAARPDSAAAFRIAIWPLNLVLLGVSVGWYFHLVRRYFY